MKIHTNDYKTAIKTAGRMIKSRITYTLNNEEVILDDDVLYSVVPNYKGAILKSVMKELDINSKYDIPLNTVLNYQFGLKVGDEYEYLNFGNYVVYKSEKQEDTETYQITCYDKMLYSMKNYESMGIAYPISVRDYINSICQHLGLTFKGSNSVFANYNKMIPNEKYLDAQGNTLGYTFRDVLDELAQVTASTICINEADDELEVRYINNTNDTINEDYLKDINVNFGEQYGAVNTIVLSRSSDSDNVYYPENLPANPIEIKIKDNQIMNGNDRSDYLPDIYAKLNGLQYYLNDFASTGICYYNLCDRYNVQIGDNTYSCVMFNDEVDITQGLEEKVYTEMPEESITDYTKADKTDRRINQTYLLVDKQNQVIESVVTNVTEQDSKISQISQTVDEINAKISDVIDITTTAEDTDAQVELENINESEPIQIKVHSVGTNIGYDYPHNDYPQNDYSGSRMLMFIRTYVEDGITKTQEIPYELPSDLLYYNQDNYDEFYLDYDSQTCQVTKKCKYNADGTVGLLDNPTTTSYEYPTITLGAGDYVVKLLGYASGYLFVRMMVQNIYTTQFYTKAETNSLVSQTASEINATVSLKLDEDEFTHASIVAKINDNTSQVQIEADKVNITANDVIDIIAGNTLNLTSKSIAISSTNFSVSTDGNITAKGGTIGGWNISVNALFTANNNYYLGTTGITATIGGTSRDNIIFKAGSNFGVNSSGTLYASNAVLSNANVSGVISSSTISGTAFTGGTININDYFSVNANGGTQISTSGGGFFTTRTSTHPYVSALNVAQGSGGITFTTGTSQGDVGGVKASLEWADNTMKTKNYNYWTGGAYTTRTGKVSVLGSSAYGTFEYYMAFVNGLLVYAGDWSGLQNYSELPWLTSA